MNVIIDSNFALGVAISAHAGQKRWDGSPYINHPIAVAKIVEEYIRNTPNLTLAPLEDFIEVCKTVAYLHDVIEDTDITHVKLYALGFNSEILENVDNITKLPNQSYIDYLRCVAKSNVSRVVKIADLTHNLSDGMQHKKGSMKDKYEIALALLKSDLGWKFLRESN